MSKKKRTKKSESVSTKSTTESSPKLKPKKTKKSTYKRGSLGQQIYLYFDRVGVDNVVYEKCLELAKKILPTTKFNKYHLSWYKNKYREIGGLKRDKK